MKMVINIIVLILIVLVFQASASDNIDTLLQNIEKKSDLSQKTKLANSGVSFIYTRDDIERMQIKNLKDVLKSAYPIGYTENRYGLPDPFFENTLHPFISSQIKVFIDDQEVTAGLYGSGLVIAGDMDVQWADHIEIYTQSPTYEYATEPTSTLIKIYTKSVKKDEGGKFISGVGSYGASEVGGYYASYIKDWSYFIYLMNDNFKRKKYKIDNQKVSRDIDSKFLIATLHKDNQNILVSALTQKRDTFINVSLDDTPTNAKFDADYFHIGYNNKKGNIKYLLSFDYDRAKSIMEDDVTPILTPPFNGLFPVKSYKTKFHSQVFSSEITYGKYFGKHHISTGVKYRAKKYFQDRNSINNINLINNKNNLQTTATLFFQDSYSLKENSIITAGVQSSKIKNNHSIQNDDILMYRLSHTYTTNNLTLKTIFNHMEMTLDPYMIGNPIYLATPNKKYKTQDIEGFVENIIYKKNNHKFEMVADYLKIKHAFSPIHSGKIVNYNKNMTEKGIILRYKLEYNDFDSLFLEVGHRTVDNVPKYNKYDANMVLIRGVNSYKKFDFFNEVMYCRNSINKKNSYDYSAGIIYHINDDLTISLKGTNLLNKGKKQRYVRIDPNSLTSPGSVKFLKPFEASIIDRKVMLRIGYTF